MQLEISLIAKFLRKSNFTRSINSLFIKNYIVNLLLINIILTIFYNF